MKTSADTIRSFVGAPRSEVDARRAATRLRNLLRCNALFSMVTGLVAAVAGGPVAELSGLDQGWVVRVLGGSLVAFAGLVFVVSGVRTSLLRPASLVVSIGDLGWVAGTLVTFALRWLSTSGVAAMVATGVVVLGLGLAQLRARAAAARAIGASEADYDEVPPVEIVTFDRRAAVTAEQLWPVMIDHELYAKLALNLKAATSLTPDGFGFQRSCTDASGRSWSETCTLWEPGRRFDVDVDTSDYPYPLARMQGSWRVEPADPSGSIVGMTFAFQPTPGIRGRLFVAVMHLAFPPILKRIVRGWIRAATTSSPHDTVGSMTSQVVGTVPDLVDDQDMNDTNDNDLTTTVTGYFECWNALDDTARAAAIERTWAPDATSTDPVAAVAGRDAIAAMMAATLDTYPGHRFAQIGDLDAHHDMVRWGWEMVDPNGQRVIDGIDIASVDDQGRLVNLTGFFGAPIPGMTSTTTS